PDERRPCQFAQPGNEQRADAQLAQAMRTSRLTDPSQAVIWNQVNQATSSRRQLTSPVREQQQGASMMPRGKKRARNQQSASQPPMTTQNIVDWLQENMPHLLGKFPGAPM
ncbi:hypothetical protein OC861_003323, partial [Tilletia horrida]